MRILSFLAGLACIQASAAPIVLIHGGQAGNQTYEQVSLAARFYGLALQSVSASKEDGMRPVVAALQQPDLLAVIIEDEALPALNRKAIFSAIDRPGTRGPAVLLIHNKCAQGCDALLKWTDGMVQVRDAQDTQVQNWQLDVTSDRDAGGELSGSALPFYGQIKCGFQLRDDSPVRVIVNASNHEHRQPVFVRVPLKSHELFVLSQLLTNDGLEALPANDLLKAFGKLMPLMLFIKETAGDRAWHTVGSFANLTIDDPWLVSPYGGLNYPALLNEMEKHSFHTTIAFIPWNFDRSQSDVVSLVRQNPSRFSIAIHGNNHDHREFGPYNSQPLSGQMVNIKQALARMEQFSHLTGIAYDPVMIFPHAVAPEKTFSILKTYNYWATVNSENIPLGSSAPSDPLFEFRPQTLLFADFLSVRRYSAEIPVSRTKLAINAFLGNPLLFYVHQQFFQPKIGAFDAIADYVNCIAPSTSWRSLGSIIQHLYLQRLRSDGEHDILAFSPDFYLTNPGPQSIRFHVRKPENFLPPLASVSVENAIIPYRASKDELTFEVVVPAKRTFHVTLQYRNNLDLVQTDTAKSNLRVKVIRYLSDMRDITLTKSKFGRSVATLYSRYQSGWLAIRLGSLRSLILIFLFVVFFCCKFYYHSRKTAVSR